MTERLLSRRRFIERMERASAVVGVEDCLLELAGLFGPQGIAGKAKNQDR